MKGFKTAKKLALLFLGLCLVTTLPAQKKLSYKKQAKLADEQFEQGNYAEAAKNYEQAYQKKTKKKELIFKAGESYYILRNYAKAISAYSKVKDENKDFPLVGLKYARSLKRDGQYDKAKAAFDSFRKSYTGKGKTILDDIVQKEIEGCDLGKQLMLAGEPEIQFSRLGQGVNTDEEEFAPLIFANNVLYYSSTLGDRARIYRSQATAGQYDKGTIPGNFPLIQNQDFCHGSLSEDGLRFYFTICNTDGKGSFTNLTSRCEIFVIRKIGENWGQPERLPDNVNAANVTSTHPFVVQQGSQEILYFVSNRAGGRGGLDIWFSTRSLTGTDNLFQDPVNLGSVVNSIGDEMTPFFDPNEQVLYFSSNGHLSIGGFDILKSRGYGNSWGAPENMGLPYNSPADDYYFVRDNTGGLGFLASNRPFAGEKQSTTNDDIYSVGQAAPPQNLVLTGNVFDGASNAPLNNIFVSVFQLEPDNSEMLLFNRSFNTPNYEFGLIPNRRFRIEVEADGYQSSSYQVATIDPNITTYGQAVYLEPNAVEPPPVDPPVNTDTNTEPDNVIETNPELDTGEFETTFPPEEENVEYTSRGTSPSDRLEYRTSATRLNGTYYKVQLISLSNYDAASTIYDAVKVYGDIETEYLLTKQLTRVLLARYLSADEAKQALQNAQSNGFDQAFVVRYDDGQRFGRVNLE